MKVGLYNLNMPASLGGGYVLRDDLAKSATQVKGRHTFELVTAPPLARGQFRLKNAWNALLNRPQGLSTSAAVHLAREVQRKHIEILWFNHFVPIHIGVPYVLNIFDLQHRLQPWFPEVSAGGQWEQREAAWATSVRRAALVNVGSQEAKEQLCHFYGVPLENVRVLPFPTPQHAIDIAEGKTTASANQNVRAKYGIKNDFLFYPAQFWSHKNHVNLLLALNLLRQKGRHLSLVLTGSDHGNLPHVQKTCRDLDLDDLVHFCGFVPYEDVLAFYGQARALSYVSFFGPENLPPLEAMALGCPVVLSNIAGVETLHGDGPVLVEPSDPASIAAGIEFVLDNPDAVRDRVRRAREVAVANDCVRYMEEFQRMLDGFEPIRRCWP